jgi:Mor family transcriptional regulator
MSEFINQLHHDVMTTAVAFGMQEPQAKAFASSLVDRIRTNYAGDEIYIHGPDKHQRNERILRMFNGVNHDVVCAEFGISKSTLYRVIRK